MNNKVKKIITIAILSYVTLSSMPVKIVSVVYS